MKLRSITALAVAAVSMSAVADTVLESDTVFARLAVSGTPASTIIALPFKGCGEDSAEIYVTNLVQTTNLQEGDTLLYKDGANWKAWEIDGSGKWVGVTTSTKKGGVQVTPNASEFKIACGKACWLNRQSTANPFYLYGQINATTNAVTVAAGDDSGPAYTIVGFPWEIGSFDVTTIAGADGDTVLLMDSAKPSGMVQYTRVDGQWKKEVYTAGSSITINGQTITTAASRTYAALGVGDVTTVAAGCGFMYGRKAKSTLTISWGN